MITYRLQRMPSGPESTIGEVMEVFPSGECRHVCYTCEDVVREIPGMPVRQWKVQDETAIPQGTYQIIIDVSARFGRRLPLLKDVPGFLGIRIHPGNRSTDTSGCLLPGMTFTGGVVFRSRAAFDLWYAEIETALLAGRRVVIEIVNAPTSHGGMA